jgi:hypothetical protein
VLLGASLPHYCQSFHPKQSLVHIYSKIPTSLRLFHKVHHQYTICYANLVSHGDPLSLVLHPFLYPPSQSPSHLASPVHHRHYHHPLVIHRTYRQFNAFPCRADFLVFLTCCEIAVVCIETAGIRTFHAGILGLSLWYRILYQRRLFLAPRPMVANEPDN